MLTFANATCMLHVCLISMYLLVAHIHLLADHLIGKSLGPVADQLFGHLFVNKVMTAEGVYPACGVTVSIIYCVVAPWSARRITAHVNRMTKLVSAEIMDEVKDEVKEYCKKEVDEISSS